MGSATLRQLAKSVSGAALLPITVEQYHEMMRTGILLEGSPTELIDGVIVLKDRGDRGGILMAGPRHTSAVGQLDFHLRAVAAHGFLCRNQSALTLGPTQEPEPDLAVVRGPRQHYFHRHPGPAETIVVVEVADASLSYDRTTKYAVYAAAAVPVYWIVNLVDEAVEIHSDPLPEERRYRTRSVARAGETLTLDLGPGQSLSIAVADIIPPAAT